MSRAAQTAALLAAVIASQPAPPDPKEEGEYMVACYRCADDRCEHDLWVCAECGGPDCAMCKNTGVIDEWEHPHFCQQCGLSGKCPECDPDRGREF